MDSEKSAEKYILAHNNGESFISFGNFPFDFPICLRKTAESENKDLFKRLVDSYLLYSQRINQRSLDQDLIKLEALDFIEFQCMIGDTGRMTVGIPIPYKLDGPTRKMFLEIYQGQLARDKRYIPTHSIQL